MPLVERRAQSSISKALVVFEALTASSDGALGLSEIAAAVGLPKSTTHRLLAELEQHRLVGRFGGKYGVGARLFELVTSVQHSAYGRLREAAMPAMASLFDRLCLSVHLGVLDRDEVLVVEKLTGVNGWALPTRVGSRLPLSCTAMGKAMLVHQPRWLERVTPAARTSHSVVAPSALMEQLRVAHCDGYAQERDETKVGISCVAAAFTFDGSVAALSVSGNSRLVDATTAGPLVRSGARRVADLAKSVVA